VAQLVQEACGRIAQLSPFRMEESLMCPVCWKDFARDIIVLGCGHSICSSCSASLLRCPICRASKAHEAKNYLAQDLLEGLTKEVSGSIKLLTESLALKEEKQQAEAKCLRALQRYHKLLLEHEVLISRLGDFKQRPIRCDFQLCSDAWQEPLQWHQVQLVPRGATFRHLRQEVSQFLGIGGLLSFDNPVTKSNFGDYHTIPDDFFSRVFSVRWIGWVPVEILHQRLWRQTLLEVAGHEVKGDKRIDLSAKCLRCDQKPQDMFLSDCMHLGVCIACANGLSLCAVCGGPRQYGYQFVGSFLKRWTAKQTQLKEQFEKLQYYLQKESSPAKTSVAEKQKE
jgi:hypothetical protein